jgi:hypothetical protein
VVLRFYDLEKIAKALVVPDDKPVEKEADIEVYKFGHDLTSLSEEQRLETIKKGYSILDKRAEQLDVADFVFLTQQIEKGRGAN